MSKSRKFKKKLKNMLGTVATLVLIVGVSVGVTLALLTAKTNKKENTFTGSKGVQGATYETNWDASTDSDTKGKTLEQLKEGEYASKPYYGYKEAEKCVPGKVINKDPRVKNLSDSESVWVMMRVEYKIAAQANSNSDKKLLPVTYEEFAKLARLSTGDLKDLASGTAVGDSTEGINDNWCLYYDSSAPEAADAADGLIKQNKAKQKTLATGITPSVEEYLPEACQYAYKVNDNPTEPNKKNGHVYYYYYYKTALAPGAVTESLFDTIHINTQTTDFDNIFLDKVYNDPNTKLKWDSEGTDARFYQINTPCKKTYNETAYYTYAALPNFQIDVQSVLVAKGSDADKTDPNDLSNSSDVETKRVLENLKSVFDAIDKKEVE